MFGTKKTKQNVNRTKMLSANLVCTDMLELVDYFGSNSSKNGVKNAIPYEYSVGESVKAPTLDMSRWVYECEVVKIVNTGTSDTYFCDIENVQVSENIDISNG
jgi:flavin reductase (DIM6/NTAB) family NADH-FMN oxidoreductase RutF